jgi:hypothetical protein
LAFNLLIDLNDLDKVCSDGRNVLFKFLAWLVLIIQPVLLLIVVQGIRKGLMIVSHFWYKVLKLLVFQLMQMISDVFKKWMHCTYFCLGFRLLKIFLLNKRSLFLLSLLLFFRDCFIRSIIKDRRSFIMNAWARWRLRYFNNLLSVMLLFFNWIKSWYKF